MEVRQRWITQKLKNTSKTATLTEPSHTELTSHLNPAGEPWDGLGDAVGWGEGSTLPRSTIRGGRRLMTMACHHVLGPLSHGGRGPGPYPAPAANLGLLRDRTGLGRFARAPSGRPPSL